MITVPLIHWQPIASMPDDRKDGRQVLLWADGEAWVAAWDSGLAQYGPYDGVWGWADARENGCRLAPEFWADINPPA